jgi:predicted  nucleic acid-binding Zn-ribbon protein
VSWIKELIAKVDRTYNAIDRAKAAGTYNALDRSRQYEQVSNAELVRAVNQAWTKIRHLESEGTRKDADIAALKTRLSRYRIAYTALVAIITGLAWEGCKALITYLAYR